jgi:hypothetical protein
MERLLTSDNPHLSRPTIEVAEGHGSSPSDDLRSLPSDQFSANTCTHQPSLLNGEFETSFKHQLSDRVAESSLVGDQSCARHCTNDLADRVSALVENSISDNTRRAYRSDLAHFEAWGGQLSAEPAAVASYIAAHAETLSVATLVRRLATISKAHQARGLPNPCRSEIVRATLRGVKRMRGIAQRQAKPLLREDLFRVLDAMGDGVKDARDRALLLIGFAGGFRRSASILPTSSASGRG